MGASFQNFHEQADAVFLPMFLEGTGAHAHTLSSLFFCELLFIIETSARISLQGGGARYKEEKEGKTLHHQETT